MNNRTETKKRKHIGEKIRQARVLANISQEELGKGLNIPGAVISRIELGQREVRASELEKIAKILNKSFSFFYSNNLENHRAFSLNGKIRDLRDLEDIDVEAIDKVIEAIRRKKK